MMSQRSSETRNKPRPDQLAGSVLIAGADGVLRLHTDLARYASPARQVVAGAERLLDPRQPDMLTMLDRVDDRDRAILAMLLEGTHPDDIAATVGISAATLRRRRADISARLRYPPTRRA
jgi:DNA-binding NarL/FixJ family response regulator